MRTTTEGPFGEVIRQTGPMARANPFRFSTKYQDDESDLLYYGCRYYNASTGRWLSRDPLEEAGGRNLLGFAANDPVNKLDINGLSVIDWLLDKVGDVAADLTAWLITDKMTITIEHNVSCPNGSSRYLIDEKRQTKSRKGTIAGGVGLHTLINLELESPSYFERIERTYACCSSCGWFSSNTTAWKNQIDDPVETVLWTGSYNTPTWPDAWVTAKKIDVVNNSSRTRQCKHGVTPDSTYDTFQVCTTHLGITHCSN